MIISDNWITLVECLDYHHKRWYERPNGRCEWMPINKTRARYLIEVLCPDEDTDLIVRQFYYRDQDAHARSRAKHEGQLVFGDWK